MQKENSGENTHIHFIFHSSCAIVFSVLVLIRKLRHATSELLLHIETFRRLARTPREAWKASEKNTFSSISTVTPSSRFFYSLFKKKNSYIFPFPIRFSWNWNNDDVQAAKIPYFSENRFSCRALCEWHGSKYKQSNAYHSFDAFTIAM